MIKCFKVKKVKKLKNDVGLDRNRTPEMSFKRYYSKGLWLPLTKS